MKKLAFGALSVLGLMSISSVALAADAEYHAGATVAIGVGIALGAAAFGSAFGQGRAASAALEGIARNPAAAGKIQVPMILALAFMEALTIFSWLVANNLVGKI